jgi:hypothetical protein
MAWPPADNRTVGYTVANTDWNELAQLALCRQGTTDPLTPTGSPYTYTNSTNYYQEVYITGGAVSSVTKNGTSLGGSLPMRVTLGPSQSITVTYTEAPTMTVDK